MKTPYDAALRVHKRRVDDLRVTLGAITAELSEIEARKTGLAAAMLHGSAVAGEDIRLPATSYYLRKIAERKQLDHARVLTEARLEETRTQAVAAFSSHHVIHSTAERFKDDHAKTVAAAEQLAIDDLAGNNFLRTRLLRARQNRSEQEHGAW